MLEWKKLGELCRIRTGKLNANQRVDDGQYPFFTCDINPYRIDTYDFDGESILVSGNGNVGHLNYYVGKFNAYQRTYVLLQFEYVSGRYLFHYLESFFKAYIWSKLKKGSVPYITLPLLSDFLIPIPSLSEQTRIVGILDTFTASIENLKQQIAQRRKQYEHYREQLLDLEGKEGVEMKRLSEVAELGTGSSNTNEELSMGKYPFFVRSQAVRYKEEYEFDETAIITSGDGVGVGKIFHFVEGKYALHQRAYRIHLVKDGIVPKFFYYYFACHFYDYIQKNAFNSSVTSVRKPMLQKFPTPIIDKETQLSIVSVLETFEASIANLEQQLAQRERQYEYYRNKLLTFE